MEWLKSLSWKYLVGVCAVILTLAIANNLRQPPERKVAWIGGQEVLKKPAAEAAQ